MAQLKPWILAGVGGSLGRLMYISREIRSGRLVPTRTLWLELPIAWGMGFSGYGLSEMITRFGWVDMNGAPMIFAAITCGHLGPRMLDKGFEWLLSWKRGKSDAA